MEEEVRISVMLRGDLYEALRAEAFERRITQRSIIEEALVDYFRTPKEE